MIDDSTLFASPAALEVAELARDIGDAADLADAATRTVKHAVDLTGARWAELVEPRDDRTIRILASTDIEVSRTMMRSGRESPDRPELPSLRPVADQLVIDDLRTDNRWPAFAALATSRVPVRSAVLQFIVVEGRYAAVLPVYDDRPGYFTPSRQHSVQILGAVAGVALAGLAAANKVRELGVALETNRTIATAVGILMSSFRISQPLAFQSLVSTSQRLNRKLRDVAEEVVRTGALPPLPERGSG